MKNSINTNMFLLKLQGYISVRVIFLSLIKFSNSRTAAFPPASSSQSNRTLDCVCLEGKLETSPWKSRELSQCPELARFEGLHYMNNCWR